MTKPRRARGGGPGRCRACNSPDSGLINDALRAGTSLNSLEKRWGMSRRALANHRDAHLSPALVQIRISGGPGPVVEHLRDLFRRAMRALETAELSGNASQLLQAIREARETAITIARVTGEDQPKPPVLNVLTDPQWLKVQDTVMVALAKHPAAALDVADALRRLRDDE